MVGLEAESCGLPMFFSSEITKEASACELGYFLPLDLSDDEWANKILTETKKNIPIRRSYAKEVEIAGFDSLEESMRLHQYYVSAMEKETDG